MKNENQNKIDTKFLQLGQMLGLSRKNIVALVKDTAPISEQNSLEFGPGPYRGGYYGTISIHEFKM